MDTTYKTNKKVLYTWLNPFAHKFCGVWTSQVLHFGVETTNRAESEHSVLKLWLSTCHGDLDTMFLNIDSLIEGQIAEIKYSLEISKLKEIHLALNKIWLEIKKVRGMVEDPEKIGADIPDVHERDMDSEMRDLTLMLADISTGPIFKVREVRRLIKGVICLVLPEDPWPLLTNPQKPQLRRDGGKRIPRKRICLTGNTCPSYIGR
ncbi:hypothetical protein M9H77_03720 [Catharanthus roseus]|uniref:Uncharacterized protein n=1 Tax=Catharanthus roseus TaxID=4058 RepID=A0ACC0CC14_CATRO|nr:hypothetical protein M9H77_03720 [Catharanthus roseus]